MGVLACAAPAWGGGGNLAAEWVRMPRDARVAYMAGAVTGLKVFSETQGGGARHVTFGIDRAVSAMDQLVADEFNQSLPMMAVAAAALAVIQGQDPRPRLAMGHAMVNPDDPMHRFITGQDAAQGPEAATPPAARREK